MRAVKGIYYEFHKERIVSRPVRRWSSGKEWRSGHPSRWKTR